MNKAQAAALHTIKEMRDQRAATAASNAHAHAHAAAATASAALDAEESHRVERVRRQSDIFASVTDQPSTLGKLLAVAEEAVSMAALHEDLRMRRAGADRNRDMAEAVLADADAARARAARATQAAADLVADCVRAELRREEADAELEADDTGSRRWTACQP